jgi:hypothetical protein
MPQERPRLVFPDGGNDTLDRWRADASWGEGSHEVIDPTDRSLEPELHEFESRGVRAVARPKLAHWWAQA